MRTIAQQNSTTAPRRRLRRPGWSGTTPVTARQRGRGQRSHCGLWAWRSCPPSKRDAVGYRCARPRPGCKNRQAGLEMIVCVRFAMGVIMLSVRGVIERPVTVVTVCSRRVSTGQVPGSCPTTMEALSPRHCRWATSDALPTPS